MQSAGLALAALRTIRPKLAEVTGTLARLAYPSALLCSLSSWFFALRAPLWLDETLSYWQVSGGFGKIWTRSAQMPSSLGYLYTLWFAKSILGSREMALKIPSLLALLSAVYFLFRATREFFDEDIAFITCIFFTLEGNVVFAATDARPYAFALLATTLAILAFTRWMTQHEMRQAIWFGASAAGILYFHYLFASILPAFAIYYVVARWGAIKRDARQVAAVFVSFTVPILPLGVRVLSLYHTRATHIVLPPRHPILSALNTLAPKQTLIGFVIAAFLAALVRKIKLPGRDTWPAILLGPLLVLVPAGVLFGLSIATPMNLVIPRYFSVVAPGSALTWALLTTRIDSKWLTKIFCMALVGLTIFELFSSGRAGGHELNFKQAHALVNAKLAQEQVPVLECSAFIESNYEPLPSDLNSESALISQLYYYPVHSPVVLLPITFSEETMWISSRVVLEAAQRHQRFLLVGTLTSYETVEWVASYARGAFTAHLIGRFGEVMVIEFRPIGAD